MFGVIYCHGPWRHIEIADPIVWVGDFNVAPQPIDVYDPKDY